MKPVFATFLIVLLVHTSSLLRTTTALAAGYPCNLKCQDRCALAGVEKRCLEYCGICCKICQCVPPGTSGNKSACPCYEALRNSKGTSKCP